MIHEILLLIASIMRLPAWFLACIIVPLVISNTKYRPFIKNDDGGQLTLLTVTAMIGSIIASLIIVIVIASSFNRPSRVDASVIAQLTEEQVGRIGEVLTQIYDSDLGWISSVREYPDSPAWIGSWNEEVRSYTHLYIVIITHTEEIAIESLGRSRILANSLHHSYIDFVNNNNTEVVLLNTFISSGSYFLPSNRRTTRSYIRIGNTVINLRESRSWLDRSNGFSNEFIMLLVELLQKD